MTATTAPAPAAGAPAPARRAADGARVTFPRVVHAEWVKLWTLRSTYWTLAVAFLLFAGIAALGAVSVRSFPDPVEGMPAGSAEVLQMYLMPAMILGPLPLIVLAALSVTGEYATGSIRSTFAAVPARLPVLAAKVLVVAVVTFVAVAVAVGASLLLAGAIAPQLAPDWGAPHVPRVVVGVVLYCTGISLLGLAVGALLRNSAAAITSVIGLVLLVENVLLMISWEPLEYVRPFLPSTAGSAITSTPEQIENSGFGMAFTPGPWVGYGILLGWVAVLLTVAAVRLRTRDA
ncbi:ABC transporter permease subunit [Cellulomonas shaoxiangyii]|uniref:ABC transporter permease n=1 Tax=Cellulomonas shaoxiangyii TaxID=2566013 RepID=A0A4P7SJU4_9CELL|nr:ABC transporter permease subunit [Cellulomonas shaoxiangyii]QCB94400.1 ABC transporter permease [Cellulomonas shaoxiangyii]TGY84770.1 ABC transporter permease [Cellulomonas shaoxiangyii]